MTAETNKPQSRIEGAVQAANYLTANDKARLMANTESLHDSQIHVDRVHGKESFAGIHERFVRVCEVIDSKMKNLVTGNIEINNPAENSYRYEFGMEDVLDGALGIAVDAETMVIGDGFLAYQDPRDNSEVMETEKETDTTHDDSEGNLEKYTMDYSYTSGLNVRIAHERVHQITAVNERLVDVAENKAQVGEVNESLQRVGAFGISPEEMEIAKPIGVRFASGVLVMSYFEVEGEVRFLIMGNAANELFTNHLAQYIDGDKVKVPEILSPIVNAVGSYEEAVRLYLSSDFAEMQARFDARHGEGEYYNYLQALELINSKVELLRRPEFGADDEILVKTEEKFNELYRDLMAKYGS